MEKKILLSAGGTGGHISPAIAVAEELLAKGWQPYLLTNERDRRFRILEDAAQMGIKILYYQAPKIPSLNFTIFWQCPLFVWRFFAAVRFIKKAHKEHSFNSILGFGGYVSAPAIWALRNTVAVYLCEQNSHIGLVNRIFRKKAKKIFLAFPLVDKNKKRSNAFASVSKSMNDNTELVGNPLRSQSRPLAEISDQQWKERFHKLMLSAYLEESSANASSYPKEIDFFLAAELPLLLVMGGSQGAVWLNEWALEYIRLQVNVKILVLAGSGNVQRLQGQIADLEPSIRRRINALGFVSEMGTIMAAGDMAVARAGGSLYELAAWRIPAVLVPYPHAADDHQTTNAQFFAKEFSFPVCAQSEGYACVNQAVNQLLDKDKRNAIRQIMVGKAFDRAGEIIAKELTAGSFAGK